MPPFPASAGAAVASASGTARRAARSVRRIGAGFYEEGGCEERASYGDGRAFARVLAARRRFLVRGLRKRRPPAGGRRLRPRGLRVRVTSRPCESGTVRVVSY